MSELVFLCVNLNDFVWFKTPLRVIPFHHDARTPTRTHTHPHARTCTYTQTQTAANKAEFPHRSKTRDANNRYMYWKNLAVLLSILNGSLFRSWMSAAVGNHARARAEREQMQVELPCLVGAGYLMFATIPDNLDRRRPTAQSTDQARASCRCKNRSTCSPRSEVTAAGEFTSLHSVVPTETLLDSFNTPFRTQRCNT